MRTIVLAMLITLGGAGEHVVSIDPTAVAVDGFLGFGAEWDPGFWSESSIAKGSDEKAWQRVVERVRWMRLPIARIMIQCRWHLREDGTHDWDTPMMRALRRHLDVCQELGTQVILTEWGCATWSKMPWITGNQDPRYADAVVASVEHLRRKYDCIRWLVLVNEPNFEGGGWDNWSTGVRQVAERLRAAGSPVTMMGPDSAHDRAWHQRGVAELKDVFAAWDLHRYHPDAECRAGGLETYVAEHWADVRAGDADAARKPLIVGEAGMQDGMSAGQNPHIEEHGYGAFMVDYAAQATRAGSHAVLAWMLDDSSHEGFSWGMWTDVAGGQRLKRWSWPWMLLTRCVPRGSTLLRVDAPAGVRVIAARLPEGAGWTFAVVNRGEAVQDIRLRLPGGARAALLRYRYAPAVMAVDGDGMPSAEGDEPADLDAGVRLHVGADEVVVLTTVR